MTRYDGGDSPEGPEVEPSSPDSATTPSARPTPTATARSTPPSSSGSSRTRPRASSSSSSSAAAPRPDSTIALAGPEESPGPLAAKVTKTEEDGLVLDLDGVEIQLGLNDIVGDFRRFFDMRFNEADADKDGALDRKEAEKSRFFRTSSTPPTATATTSSPGPS